MSAREGSGREPVRDRTGRETARALGVRYGTLQSWAHDGFVPHDRTAGGARRYDIEEARYVLRARLARLRKLREKRGADPAPELDAATRYQARRTFRVHCLTCGRDLPDHGQDITTRAAAEAVMRAHEEQVHAGAGS